MDSIKLMKLLHKEQISVKEFHEITNSENVAEVREMKPDGRFNNAKKFDIRLLEGDNYYVYIKKEKLFGLF